ncbi:MAG: NADH-quinone oxidoreductase subunit L, partial [Zetaproteobacteria bacterium]
MDLTELLEIGEKERQAQRGIRIRVCVAAGCLSANAQAVKQSLETAVADAGLGESVQVVGVGCLGLCSGGPLVAVDPENVLYEKVTPADAPSIVAALSGGGQATAQQADFNHPFFTRQVPIVLENSGRIDPERIEDYIAADGYQPLYHALREMKPGDVVDAITKSGLRGR